MKYKIGDKVRIKSIDWYNENKDECGYVRCTDFLFTPEHSKYCGCEFTISHITEFQIPSYVMEGNGHEWTDEMIEGLVEEETYDFLKTDKPYPSPEDCLDNIQFVIDNELKLPEGYIFKDENGNVINATKIVLEKKKKEYPKTYEECKRIMGVELWNTLWGEDATEYEEQTEDLIDAFIRLKVCRDAYWKIAGDEMGLGKDLSWVPDWMCLDPVYVILYQYHGIYKAEVNGGTSCIFAFPTEEMRDSFYENFKELIEICKELL